MDDAQNIWFPGTNATSNAERRFVEAIRGRAAGWAQLGLPHTRSAGAPVVRPLLGVELRNTNASLRWLWILFVETKRELSIQCSWGDDTRLNEWGPTAGDVTITLPRLTGTPGELADYASEWITTQATRRRPDSLND
ncbi:MAG: hypothetical protein ACTHNQ_13795 [Microbacterium sp.]|uniref:hypothetical protein n=1 Tax=Microbacterium sp. TaxID=51671 RepID=UPI003F7EE958